MDEPVVFSSAYESLQRALGPQLDAAALARFKALGVDLASPLHPAYPLATWAESLKVAASLVAPGRPEEEAMQMLGRRIFLGFGETLLGKAVVGILRLIGPRRALERMRRNLRNINNFSETTLTEVAPGVFHLWCSLVSFPGYYRGLVGTGLEASGARQVSIRTLSHDSKGATFEITWAA